MVPSTVITATSGITPTLATTVAAATTQAVAPTAASTIVALTAAPTFPSLGSIVQAASPLNTVSDPSLALLLVLCRGAYLHVGRFCALTFRRTISPTSVPVPDSL